MIALILAAGKGTRIKDVISEKSKSLIPVNGLSVLLNSLNNITACQHISKIVITIGYEENDIQQIVGDSYNGIPIIYYVQNELFGIVHTIYENMNTINDQGEDVFLLLGDEYFDKPTYQQMIESFYRENADIVFGIIHTNDERIIKNNYSVMFDSGNNLIELVEKPKVVTNDIAGTGSIIFKIEALQRFYSISDVTTIKNSDLVDIISKSKDNGDKVLTWSLDCRYSNINSKECLLSLYENKAEYPEDKNIVSLFKEQVQKSGSDIAVICGENNVTYRQLDFMSDNIANNLLQIIDEKHAVIAILLGRSIEYIITMLGILKAGYTYVPLDNAYPRHRIERMLKIADAKLIIMDNQKKSTEIDSVKTADYHELIVETKNDRIDYNNIDSNSLAYIMFTSGSTGFPKGAVITHKNIINNVWGLKKEIYSLYNQRLKVGVVASFIFDMSVQQIYPALIFGHLINILPYGWNADGGKILKFLNDVDISDGTPIFLDMLLEHMDSNTEAKCRLKHFILGGEELTYNAAKKYFQYCPESKITNIYGPTECTVEATTYFINKDILDNTDSVFIGKPMNNIRIYILDDKRKMVTTNEIGEIYIAGDCVGNGYINNIQLTEESFVPDILCEGKRMYKTGDLGAWQPDGNIKFYGRKDSQIKVKGYRIELREIEIELEKIEVIKTARVLVRKENINDKNNKKLVAYILCNSSDLSVEAIISDLSKNLPTYMIPSYFVPVKCFPKNENGKLDINALPDYKENCLKNLSQISSREFSKTEEIIYKIILEIFNYEEIDIGASFIALGGDSLQFYQIITRVKNKVNAQISFSDINVYMNIEDIIRIISSKIVPEHQEKEEKKFRFGALDCTPNQKYLIEVEKNFLKYNLSNIPNHMVYFIPLLEKPDVERLDSALKYVTRGNDAFKMIFLVNDIRSKVKCMENYEYSLKYLYVDNLEHEYLITFFDPTVIHRLPLMQMILFECNAEYKIGLFIHHVISDFLSFHFFMEDLENYYFNQVATIEKGASYFDYISIFNRNKNSEKVLNDVAFWNEYIKEYTIPKLTQSKSITNYESEALYSEIKYQYDSTKVKKIRSFCKKNSVPENATFMAAFLTALEMRGNKNTISINTFMSGRNSISDFRTLGFFSSMFCYNHKTEHESFAEKIKRVADDLEILYTHENGLDILELTSDIQNEDLAAKWNYMPMDVVFDYQKCYNSTTRTKRLWNIANTYETNLMRNAVVFRIYDYKDSCEIIIYYNSTLYKKEIIDEFMSGYNYVLDNNI